MMICLLVAAVLFFLFLFWFWHCCCCNYTTRLEPSLAWYFHAVRISRETIRISISGQPRLQDGTPTINCSNAVNLRIYRLCTEDVGSAMHAHGGAERLTL